jgi:hypothetical protein
MREEHFDRCAFDNQRSRPVSAGTRLAYSDYVFMSTRQHSLSNERRLATPLWALNDHKLQELLVVFMEERAGIRHRKGTLQERLERAKRAVIAQHPKKMRTLKSLCMRFVDLLKHGSAQSEEECAAAMEKRSGGTPPLDGLAKPFHEEYNLRTLDIEIEALDTYLSYTRTGGADILAAIVYLYYRVGLDSVGVGIQLGLKPPHVRQILYRLNQTWLDQMGQPESAEPEFGPMFEGVV